MKAVRLNQWAQPMQLEELSQPSAAEGDVLVRIHAAAVNPLDGVIAAGYLPDYFQVPMTPGLDFSGEVLAVGAGIDHVQPGDAVYGMNFGCGTFAEVAAVKGSSVARKPRSLDDVSAAGVPLAALTANHTLFELAQLQSGERLLIIGAGGGVGCFAVQMAKAAGAAVIAYDHGDKGAFLTGLGADEYIDGYQRQLEDAPGPFDVVLDLVGGELIERALNMLQPGARYVSAAAVLPEGTAAERGVIVKNAAASSSPQVLTEVAQQIDAGKLKVFVSRIYPLDQAQQALFDNPKDPGKVVIKVR